MSFKVGDKVVLNQRYFSEGKGAGYSLKYPRTKGHFFTVKKVTKIDHPRCKGDLVDVDGGKYKEISQICECFLKTAVE